MVGPARDAYGSPTSSTSGRGGPRGTAASPSSRKPTQDDIRALVTAITGGGGMSTLSYTFPQQGALDEGQKPQTVQTVEQAGIWGGFYQQASFDMKYSLLQFADDVRGNGNFKALPDNWPIRIPPTGPNHAKRYRDQIFTGDPQLTVEFPGERDSESRKDKERRWTAYIMGEIQREEQVTEQSPLDSHKQHCVDFGLCARYDILDLTRWPERPKKKRSESMDEFHERMEQYKADRRAISPFVVRDVHCLNVAYDLTGPLPRWAIVREPIWAWDAVERYPHWNQENRNVQPSAGAQPLVKIEYWSRDWYAVYLNGEPALGPSDGADSHGVAKNPYGHIPLTFAAGGFGQSDVANRPEVLLQGIYRNMRPMLLEDAIQFNTESVYFRRVSFGPKVYIQGPETELDSARADAIESDLLSGPTNVARVPSTWKVGEIPPSQVPPELIQRRMEIRQDLEESTAYGAAAGAPQEGPAAKYQMMVAQTDKRVALDVLHLQQMMEQWATNRLRALKHLDGLAGEKVGANVAAAGEAPRWVDLDPAELPDYIKVTCKLTSDSETEKARKEQSGLALMERNLLSDEDFWREYMDDPDPERRIAGVLNYQLRQNVTLPAMMQVAQQGLVAFAIQQAQQYGMMPQLLAEVQRWQMAQEAARQREADEQMAAAAVGPLSAAVGQNGTGAGAPAGYGAGQPGQPPVLSVEPIQPKTGPQGMMLPGETQSRGVDRQLNPAGPADGGFFPRVAGAGAR